MSDDCQREMTLQEWVERLPEIHRARKEYAALVAEVEKFTSTNIASDEITDYDCGIINDYGGGNVQWWQDYLRHEINRCNEYWRSATSHVA